MMQNLKKSQNEFWDKIAPFKEFKDPFHLSQLQSHINVDSLIVEYGCGYGRLLNLLHQHGFKNTLGFDFSQGMIDRGKKMFPYLNMHLINHGTIPLQNESVDAAILSTILCCVPDDQSQEQIIEEISRTLRPGAILYLTDFLITDTAHMIKKYQKDFQTFNEWGVYQTTEGALVRHFTKAHIEKLLNNFIVHWLHEEDFVTMNNNLVRTFHGIYKKKSMRVKKASNMRN